MRSVRTVAELRAELAPARAQGSTVGLVPTMGALHEGHLSLIARAREQCDVVVVSLFVNPAQFNERADLERYPRQRAADARSRRRPAPTCCSPPSVEEVYPRASRPRRGARRERAPRGRARGAEHFRGVTTVVTKLLCMAQPDVAYFGQKDAQQVRRDPPPGRGPEPAGADRGAADRARARRAGDVQPQRAAQRRRARRALALPAALRRAPRLAARRRALGGALLERRAASGCAARVSSPSTSRSSTPTRSSRFERSTARRCWRSPPASARSG